MNSPWFKHEFRAMGGPCEVVIADASPSQAKAIARDVEQEVLRIERKYSRYIDDSILSQINTAAGVEACVVDDETRHLLDVAQTLYELSEGLFDISSGILRRAWNFKEAQIPSQSMLTALTPLIDWSSIELNGDSIKLPKVGMEIDFGGFGKEYAADRAASVLREAGLKHAYVNLAGDFHIVGPKPDGSPWVIGIAHPRKPKTLIASIPISAGALTTSGDYERYFEIGNKRYCHILNPRTAQPVQYWQSVSVLAPTALMAGSYSTIAMLLEKKGLGFLQDSALNFLAVDPDGQLLQQEM